MYRFWQPKINNAAIGPLGILKIYMATWHATSISATCSILCFLFYCVHPLA